MVDLRGAFSHFVCYMYTKANPKTSPEDHPPLCSALQPFHLSQLIGHWWNNYRTPVFEKYSCFIDACYIASRLSSIGMDCFQNQFLHWTVWMLCSMHQTQVSRSCSTNDRLAEKDEMVAVQKNIEAGDLLGKSWDCL